MELICDYFDYGYEILYNYGSDEIKNGDQLAAFIENISKKGSKVFVAIDNAHDKRTSSIFYVMDKLSGYELKKNIRFILTARLPEFDWFIKNRLSIVQENIRNSIMKLSDNNDFRYELPLFKKEEIKEFIQLYNPTHNENLEEMAKQIHKDTGGHPIMVKFFVFGNGLHIDVRDRYLKYLIDQQTKLPDPSMIQTMLICSLLDIANLSITDKLLESMEILSYAYALEHTTLYRYSGSLWKTIHPRWDIEFLSFLYNEKEKGILLKREEYLKKAINIIFNIKNEQISASVIGTIYGIAAVRIDGVTKIPIDIVENVIQNQMETSDYLSNETKSNLYATVIAHAYGMLDKREEALDRCNKAIKIDPNNVIAWYDKGIALATLEKYKEAKDSFDKAIEIDKEFDLAWYDKGIALANLKKYEEAKDSFDKAIEIDPNYVDALNGKAWMLAKMDKNREALPIIEKALAIEPDHADALATKRLILYNLERKGIKKL